MKRRRKQGVVGQIGLGIMGGAFAKHLLAAGFDVVGYDVSADALKRLTRAGGKAAGSIQEVAEKARIINSDMAGVHVLFIGARENARLPKVIGALGNMPVLVVTEAPDGLERGAMINFVTTDRVQFEVAVSNAAKAGLHLNARLLSVAIRVRKGGIEMLWDGHGLLARAYRAKPNLLAANRA